MEDFFLVGLKIGDGHRYLPGKWMQFYPGLKIDLNGQLIRIADNPTFIDDFYGNRVSSVSAMVGLNGSGKSSTLNYLKQLFVKEKTSLRSRGDDVILFIAGDKLFIYVSSNGRANYVVENTSSMPHEVIIYYDYPKLFDKLKNYTAAFYTNGLDLDQKEFEPTNYFNISTGYLLGNLGKINQKLRNPRIKAQAAVKRYQYTEFIREIDFLANLPGGPGLQIPFKAFSEVIVPVRETIKNDYVKLLNKLFKSYQNYEKGSVDPPTQRWEAMTRSAENYFFMEKRSQLYSRRFYELVLAENILVLLIEHVVEACLLVDDSSKHQLITLVSEYFDSDGHQKFMDFAHSGMIRQLQNQLELLSVQDDKLKDKLAIISKGLTNLRPLREFTQDLLSYTDITEGQLSLSLQQHDINAFLERFYSFQRCEFISFKWPKLSAGEESLLAFFSRLDAVLKNSKGRNILLLIDEGDLYFHPEWQRNYLHYIIDFLERENPEIRRVQIILTTHSPFLVSDIPREYQVYLGEPVLPSGVAPANDKETFGGNLYALFSNHFFLGGSTTSEFARRKIKNNILAVIDSRELMTQPMLTRLHLLIDKVGDPVVRDILLLRLKERSRR